MAETGRELSQISIDVENIGGINQTNVQFEPGTTVLSGRNATNRTSLLKSIMAALGSDVSALKGDADQGSVELTLDGETHTRTLSRQNDHVTTSGDPYLSEPMLADLFAFLLEDNEARRAVERGDDLRELIMRPVDTAEIQRRIDEILQEKKRIASELDELDTLEETQTRLRENRADIEDTIQETSEQLEEKRGQMDAADADIEESRKEKEELEAKLGELQDTRSQLEDVRYQIEMERDSVESLQNDREELTETLAELPETPAAAVTDIEHELERLRAKRETVERTINDLQSIITFNEDALEGDGANPLTSLSDEGTGADLSDLTAPDESVTCWTCGSTVQTTQMEKTLDRLKSLRKENTGKLNELNSQIEDLQSERSTYQQQQDRRTDLKRNLSRIEDEIDDRQARRESLENNQTELETEIESLEETVDSLHEEDYSEILDLQKDVNQLEFELEQAERERSDIQSQLSDIENSLEEREALRSRREEIQSELEDLRTRVKRIEKEAVEEFNTQMEAVLDILDYGNIERIWIERKRKEVREGRRKVEKSQFDLHLVRTTESGSTYEDTVDHLSESEREVTGLIFALAGFLVHEVYEIVPFILLDSLEAIDSHRIASLIDYLEDHVENLIVALLPEDADALSDSYRYIENV